MRDFNFFTDLKPKKKKTTSTSTYVALVVLLAALAIGGSYYYFYTELEEVNDEIDRVEAQLQDEVFIAQHEGVQEMNTRVGEMQQELEEIDQIVFSLESNMVIDNLLINEIAMANPENIAIENINFSDRNVNLEGTSTTKNALALFEHNLRGNERFEGPFIPNIEEVEEDLYTFSLSFHIVEEESPFDIDTPDDLEEEDEEGDADGS
ncbi:PilN domain-containing protein [Isachenkonia alkalipeptolytica]|uniref:PilN domain-containing protein n=1 Tax=Isachenkonia alkalipeptolytica TaxID=2565777 RepID=A0AA44BDW9_9CLOT|nr:PilN domain-containing protein [Isachenkonia alkalipeptolytica]NBG87525.1 PilN domain-containing protein [Isachenkonia alkalipeptolytica]